MGLSSIAMDDPPKHPPKEGTESPAEADEVQAGTGRRRRRPKGRKGPPREDHVGQGARLSDTVEARAERVIAELDGLVHALALEQGFTPSARAPSEGEDLVVTLSTGLGGSGDRGSARWLLEGLREHVGEAIRGATAFHQGHVYCFFTDQPRSPYSSPPHGVDVFAGYTANGKPAWIGFANLCLAQQEPRVDRIYADTPHVIALVQRQDALTGGLLPGFGRGSLAWHLHGQVACGLIPRDLDLKNRTGERVALTLQIIETRQRAGRGRLQLNVIGLSPLAIAEAAASAAPSSPAEAFRRLIRATREKVDALGRRAALATRRGGTFELAAHVDALLNRLRSDLLRVFKSRDHRTRHAEERHESGERPTGLALSDSLEAGQGRFLRDERRDTVVVLGPKQRVHVFSRVGRHVTSLELLPQEVARRVDSGRWSPLEPHAVGIFQHMLKTIRAGPA